VFLKSLCLKNLPYLTVDCRVMLHNDLNCDSHEALSVLLIRALQPTAEQEMR
jgi:hypothetical protein